MPWKPRRAVATDYFPHAIRSGLAQRIDCSGFHTLPIAIEDANTANLKAAPGK
jgi:hypothetical protein